MKESERHHFIPEFFIKAFTNDNGKIFVHNKQFGKTDKISKSPKQIFFEWNRNTFKIDDYETDFLEKVYNLGESKFSVTHRKLIEKFEPVEITAYDILHLTLFIAEIYWRVPSQDSIASQIFQNFEEQKLLFKIKNKTTGENIPIGKLKRLITSKGFIGSMKKIKGLQEYLHSSKNINIKNWRIYSLPKEAPRFKIICDNPVIKRNESEDLLDSELIFPLSRGKTVFHTKGKKLKEIPADNKILIDILLFLQSEKYVASADYDYLVSISEISQFYNTPEKVKILKEQIFQVFD